jgi:hypothetical protein
MKSYPVIDAVNCQTDQHLTVDTEKVEALVLAFNASARLIIRGPGVQVPQEPRK